MSLVTNRVCGDRSLHETVDAGGRVVRPPPGWRLTFHPVGRPDPRPWPYVNAEAQVFRCGDEIPVEGLMDDLA
jgi:hypothetical protein